jgi:hypothetical protein
MLNTFGSNAASGICSNLIRKEGWDAMPTFDINLRSAPAQSYFSAITSWSIVWFYAPLAVGVILAVLGAWAYA